MVLPHLVSPGLMSLTFLANYQQRIWVVVGPFALVLSGFAVASYVAWDTAVFVQFASTSALVGTLLLQSALPPYLLASWLYLYRETLRLEKLTRGIADDEASTRLLEKVSSLRSSAFLTVLFAVLWGLHQNDELFLHIVTGNDFGLGDLSILFGNLMIWLCVGFLVAWRVPVSLALRHYGRSLQIDLYALEIALPVTYLAAKDVLIIAGAMSFMALQSLDAEFRWVNYEGGFIVGIPVAIALLLTPLTGIRANVTACKRSRLEEISAQIAATDRSDMVTIELLQAHADRIRRLSNWSIDLRVAARIVGYVVIAPIAWVGAALVENLVDKF